MPLNEMMLGVGLFAGSVMISINNTTSVSEGTLVSFIFVAGFCFMVIAVLQYFAIQSVYAYMLVMSVIGACIAGAFVFWQSLLQRYTTDTMTGRVFSLSTLISNISLPVAYGLFGLLLNLSFHFGFNGGLRGGLNRFMFVFILPSIEFANE